MRSPFAISSGKWQYRTRAYAVVLDEKLHAGAGEGALVVAHALAVWLAGARIGAARIYAEAKEGN